MERRDRRGVGLYEEMMRILDKLWRAGRQPSDFRRLDILNSQPATDATCSQTHQTTGRQKPTRNIT